jgi:hypothetical protein
VESDRNLPMFRRNVLPPPAGITVFFLMVAFLAYFVLTLKMEAVRSSETSVNFYPTTQRHISEDSICYSRCQDNPESNKLILYKTEWTVYARNKTYHFINISVML